MFIGHFALAYGARKAAPEVSLGWLFAAAQLADLAWPTLVLAGVETFRIAPGITAFTPLDFVSYPYSHSLVALAIWAAAMGAGYALWRRARLRAVLILGGLVLSHWVLDVVSHRPDMPLGIGDGAKLGLGLWNSVPATIAVEVTLFAAGVALYFSSTRAADRIGRLGAWSLVAFLVVIYFANAFGPPPPSVAAVTWSAEALWLLVAWAGWTDRHRRVEPSPTASGAAG